MSYDFRKIYNVAEEAGCEISSDTVIDKQAARLDLVKTWIDSNFADIFKCGDVVTTSTSAKLQVYFKGTQCGFFIQQGIAKTGQYNGMGAFTTQGDIKVASISSVGWLADASLRLLVIKSKYGIIAGFYKDVISNNVCAMAINLGDRLMPVVIDATGTHSQMHIASGSSAAVVTELTACSQTDDAFLVKFVPPFYDVIPDGVYWNVGSSTNNCVIFSVGDGSEKYAELQGAEGYNTIALKLEEPTAADYA